MAIRQVSYWIDSEVHSWGIWGLQSPDPHALVYFEETWGTAIQLVYHLDKHVWSVLWPAITLHGQKFVVYCKSPNIVYLITCRRCGQQYVGKTGQLLHHRVNIHRFNIAHGRTEESPVAEHFTGDGHTQVDMVVAVIPQLYSRDSCLRKIRESRWIRTVGTSYYSGMNLRVDSLWNLPNHHQPTPWILSMPLGHQSCTLEHPTNRRLYS